MDVVTKLPWFLYALRVQWSPIWSPRSTTHISLWAKPDLATVLRGSHARPPREEDLVAPGWCLPSFVPQNHDFCSHPIRVCFLGYDLYKTIVKWAQLGTSFPGILAYSHFSLLYLLYFFLHLKKNGRFVFVWFWGLTGTSCMLSIHYHWAVHPRPHPQDHSEHNSSH